MPDASREAPEPELAPGADTAQSEPESEPEPTPLLVPAEGVPELTISTDQIARAADLLASGHGPFAVDAERASGFRYSNRAYLIQIRRAGAGTVLIDPIGGSADPAVALRPIAEVLTTSEWILHSADQDLPCLDGVGMRPPALYDTELAGRLAGYDRVNLAAMVRRLLGLGLAKGHGAADWSKRPLPDTWLNYAALDVEVLIELRFAIADVLEEQGKTSWAAEEFEHLRLAEPPPPRTDPWRRTSGIHKLRQPRQLAAVRELWTTRDEIARRRDIAPGRILPDSAIVSAASADPKSVAELTALPVFGGPRQRRGAATWLAALERARTGSQPPPTQKVSAGTPPVARWHRRKPEAAARLQAVRDAIGGLSRQVDVPTENLVPPDLVRRLCWDWQPGGPESSSEAPRADYIAGVVADFLRDSGARGWQRELVTRLIADVLTAEAEQ